MVSVKKRLEYSAYAFVAILAVAASLESAFTPSAELPAGAPREKLKGDLQAFEDVIAKCKDPKTCKLPSLMLVPSDSYTGWIS